MIALLTSLGRRFNFSCKTHPVPLAIEEESSAFHQDVPTDVRNTKAALGSGGSPASTNITTGSSISSDEDSYDDAASSSTSAHAVSPLQEVCLGGGPRPKQRRSVLSAAQDSDEDAPRESEAWFLEHCCRSGKTWIAMRAIFGDRIVAGPGVELRPHQLDALHQLQGLDGGSDGRHRSMCVFSTLAVLDQFVEDYLKKGITCDYFNNLGRVVNISSNDSCSGSVDSSLYTLRGSHHDITEGALQDVLRDESSPLLLLTTYQSARRVHVALIASGLSMDLVVCDEAHNVVAPRTRFLAENTPETRLHYPYRLYMTATPHEGMLCDEDVYGCLSDPTSWHRFRYSDLVEAQKTYDSPCVKEFDVRVLFNGPKLADVVVDKGTDCDALDQEDLSSRDAR